MTAVDILNLFARGSSDAASGYQFTVAAYRQASEQIAVEYDERNSCIPS